MFPYQIDSPWPVPSVFGNRSKVFSKRIHRFFQHNFHLTGYTHNAQTVIVKCFSLTLQLKQNLNNNKCLWQICSRNIVVISNVITVKIDSQHNNYNDMSTPISQLEATQRIILKVILSTGNVGECRAASHIIDNIITGAAIALPACSPSSADWTFSHITSAQLLSKKTWSKSHMTGYRHYFSLYTAM